MPKYKKILIIVIILLVALSWTFSLMSKEISSQESGFVAELFRPVLDFIFGETNYNMEFFEQLIRKTAHFSEYLAITCLLTLVLEPVNAGIPLTLLIAMALGLMDETIQVFSHRGSSVLDVWLDFAGSFVGFLIGNLIYYLIIKRKKPVLE